MFCLHTKLFRAVTKLFPNIRVYSYICHHEGY